MNIFEKSLQKVKLASRKLAQVNTKDTNKILISLAEEIELNLDKIIKANELDLSKMNPTDPKYDRLKLTEERLASIAQDILSISKLKTPVGEVLEKQTLPNGLKLRKVSVPLGVIGIIYEARPNVTFDVFALCFKSGNACVLKGGSEAENSNKIIVSLIQKVLKKHNLDPNTVLLLGNNRKYTNMLLKANKFVDVIIPRGGSSLIKFVRDNSTDPVIETGAGVVHTYFDKDGDNEIGRDIVFNAKTRRVSVCNSLDTLLIHKDRLDDLPKLVIELENKNVQIFADTKAFKAIRKYYNPKLLKPALNKHFGLEFLDYKLAIKTVDSIEEAIDHINTFGSMHSEAIISDNKKAIEKFFNEIDAAAIYSNTSTAFTDGGQFGMGAEIGISTQKLHARGPMALPELTSYKWLVEGKGQVRG